MRAEFESYRTPEQVMGMPVYRLTLDAREIFALYSLEEYYEVLSVSYPAGGLPSLAECNAVARLAFGSKVKPRIRRGYACVFIERRK